MPKQRDLLLAIQDGNLEVVQSILQKQPDLINERTEQGVPLTLLAAYHQKMDVFHFLIAQKRTLSFFEAIAVGNLELVQQELASSPELLNGFSSDGFTPLTFAAYFSQEEVATFLVGQGADINLASRNHMQVAPLHSAVATQNIGLVQLFLQKGAQVNQPQMEGIRPLHAAVHRGQTEMVKLLLDHGADPALATDDGRTSISIAIAEEKVEIRKMLEKE